VEHENGITLSSRKKPALRERAQRATRESKRKADWVSEIGSGNSDVAAI
jgi:hypothetical protein